MFFVIYSLEIMDLLELWLFFKLEIVLIEVLRFLVDEDWEKKIEGLNFIRCLVVFYFEILNIKLYEINFVVV